MKYIEELEAGNIFRYDQRLFLMTTDFKKNNARLCFDISNGYPKWFEPNSIVEPSLIFTMDNDNNITPINRE